MKAFTMTQFRPSKPEEKPRPLWNSHTLRAQKCGKKVMATTKPEARRTK